MDIPSPLDSEKKNKEEVQKRQNIIFGTLLFIGLAAFSLGIFQIIGTINSPFQVKESPKNSNSPLITDLSEEEKIAELKNKDTDQDGLNDYDELYIYNTSPYVRDSDSDGQLDNEEVKSGSDPNCPAGQPCSSAPEGSGEGTNTNNNSDTNTNTNTSLPATGELSPGDLRTTLKNMGVPASMIDTMDDNTLQEVYQQTVKETGVNPNQSTGEAPSNLANLSPSETSPEEITLKTLQSFSPDQIRDLLRKSGIEESSLSQIDDATLQTIFQEAINEQLATTPSQ